MSGRASGAGVVSSRQRGEWGTHGAIAVEIGVSALRQGHMAVLHR